MDDLKDKDTVSVYFVNAALSHLDEAARAHALKTSGIPSELLGSPQARVTAPAFSALWRATALALNDEFFGLDGRPMKVGSFALLCHAVLACDNLDQALKRALRGFALFLDDIHGELRLDGAHAVIDVHNRIQAPQDRLFADETFLILVHGLMCWLIGHRVPLAQVSLAHARPLHAREYTRMYSQHLAFDQQLTRISFDAQVLGRPLVQNAATLQQFLKSAPQSVFLKYKNEDSWTVKLRRRLRSALGSETWPVFEELAAELGTTPTTLRRRLEAEGNSFQDIKDQLRSDLAINLLCHSAQSIDDIGAQLGFQDASAFHRAFKRWNGLQPGEYRQRRLSAAPPLKDR
ncbi:AraC family transcriptional regulator [Aquabacterium sp.]|uniref:AraC family transcriptional regulator n=1 Tax=Aquabacterium sp. TaxID=1872578 RepID=UPI0025B84F56|nr:AraC family transcriptional regulator [Aquabacterium sp.]